MSPTTYAPAGTPPFYAHPDKACRDVDPELFWPSERTNLKVRGAAAKRVCAGCSIRQECLDWAVDNFQDHGIWGGHDEKQRRDIRESGRCRDVGCRLCARAAA